LLNEHKRTSRTERIEDQPAEFSATENGKARLVTRSLSIQFSARFSEQQDFAVGTITRTNQQWEARISSLAASAGSRWFSIGAASDHLM
jgi:hypothetical protein